MERLIYDRIKLLERDHWWFRGRRAVLTRMIEGLAPPKGARILEAGCGTGGNLPMLARFGEVSALEPDGPSREHVAAEYGVIARDGLLPDALPFAPESFDLVCAFDVVEHVDDDAATVKALAGLVDRGGALLITVPAYQWMWSHHDTLHHHRRRYRLAEIRRLCEAAGLRIEKATYFNTLLLPPAVLQRLAKRMLGINTADDAMPSPWLNRLLSGIFGLEAGWLAARRLPLGLSILIAARKA